MLDLVTKYGIYFFLEDKVEYSLSFINIVFCKHLNRGSFGGELFVGQYYVMQFIILLVILSMFVFLYSSKSRAYVLSQIYKTFFLMDKEILNIYIIIILSGVVGNIIDRLVMGGVVDWVIISIKPLSVSTFIFNLADTYILFFGIFFLLIHYSFCLIKYRNEKKILKNTCESKVLE